MPIILDTYIFQSPYHKNLQRNTNERFLATAVDIHKDIGIILCSSGTTGLPKGVQLTHFNLIAAARLVVDVVRMFDRKPNDAVILGVIPWFHAFGCITLFGICLSNTKFVSLPKFQENLFLSCIEVSLIVIFRGKKS